MSSVNPEFKFIRLEESERFYKDFETLYLSCHDKESDHWRVVFYGVCTYRELVKYDQYLQENFEGFDFNEHVRIIASPLSTLNFSAATIALKDVCRLT